MRVGYVANELQLSALEILRVRMRKALEAVRRLAK
jgi:hypothetical protein